MDNRLAMLILTIVISIGAGATTPGYAAKFSAPTRAGVTVADEAAAAPGLKPNPGCFPSGKVQPMYSLQYSHGTFCLRSHTQGDFTVVSGSLFLGGKSYPVLGTFDQLGASAQWMNLTVNFPNGRGAFFGLDWVTGGSCAACGPIPWTNHWRRA